MNNLKSVVARYLSLALFFLAPLLFTSKVLAMNGWHFIGLNGHDVCCVAIDKENESNVIVATSDSLFSSSDGGFSWRVNSGSFASLAIGSRWFAGGSSYLLSSLDNGGSWSNINLGVRSFYLDSLVLSGDGGKIFFGNYRGVFEVTSDGGSWSLRNTGLKNNGLSGYTKMPALALHDDGITMFAGTDRGIFKTKDGGVSWKLVNNGLSVLSSGSSYGISVNSIVLNSRKNFLFAATNKGLFKSEDQGESWRLLKTGLSSSLSVYSVVSSADSQMVFIGTNKGVFKSVNGGEGWEDFNDGLPEAAAVNSLALDKDEKNLFSSVYRLGIYKRPTINSADDYLVQDISLFDVDVFEEKYVNDVKVRVTINSRKFYESNGAYNIYVVALIPGEIFGSNSPVLVQKLNNGEWALVDGYLNSYLNISSTSDVKFEIFPFLSALDFSGAEFYIGYGTSSEEMLLSNRYKMIYKIK